MIFVGSVLYCPDSMPCRIEYNSRARDPGVSPASQLRGTSGSDCPDCLFGARCVEPNLGPHKSVVATVPLKFVPGRFGLTHRTRGLRTPFFCPSLGLHMRNGPCLGSLEGSGFYHKLGKILGEGGSRPWLVIILS